MHKISPMMTKLINCIVMLIATTIHLVSQQDYIISEQYKSEIKNVADIDVIRDAFDYILILEPETRADHILLTEVAAPPFKEEARANLFEDLLEQAGVDSVWMDDVGNVLAMRRGLSGERTVCLDAHLDTVFPEGTDVSVVERGDTLYAPGIGDDTRGLAVLLTIVKTMDHLNIRTDDHLLFVGSVGEEGLGDLRGVKHIFREDGPPIDSWISIDGGDVGRVLNQALGSYRYRVTFKGPGGHSWGAFGLVNPHHALGDAIARFVDRADDYVGRGPRTSYNVGVISGGTSVNSIPYESIMEIDIRSVEPSRLDSMELLLRRSVQEALGHQNAKKSLGGDLVVDIEKIGDRPSGEISSDVKLVQRSLAATAQMGRRPKLSRGSTNANIPISLNIPAVTIGRGGIGANGHSLDEWWLNKEGHKAIQMALLLLITEAGLSKG